MNFTNFTHSEKVSMKSKVYSVGFTDDKDRFVSNTKVRAPAFHDAVAKVMAKYPDREIRYLELDKDEEEIIE